MSAVTTILLSVGCEEDEGRIAEVNDRLRDEAGLPDWTLREISDGEFGGDKVPEPLWGGAVKYFDMERFAAVMRATPWREPGAVQVMILDERTSFRWRLLGLDDLRDPS